MSIFKQIGSDVEFFVSRDGEIESVNELIKGSKECPKLVKDGNLQEDGVCAEMAIDPCITLSDWLSKLASVHMQLSDQVGVNNYELVCKSSHRYTKDKLLGFTGKEMAMGCSRDFNVYTDSYNPKPNPKQRLRTAAGHIHYSYVSPHVETTKRIAMCMDYILGVWSVLHDTDVFRRTMYGKAGCIRIKPYGGEYRTLGNFWMTNTARQRYVYNMTKLCVERHASLLPVFSLIADEKKIQAIINECDAESAALLYPQILKVLSNKEMCDERAA